MATSAEQLFQRRNTLAFIQANPQQITLTPRSPVNSGTGRRWINQEIREEQTFRLIDQSSTSGPQPGDVLAGDGTQRKVTYQLLGRWDAAIGLWDFWIDSAGIKCEVVELLPDNGYERRAKVVRYGEV